MLAAMLRSRNVTETLWLQDGAIGAKYGFYPMDIRRPPGTRLTLNLWVMLVEAGRAVREQPLRANGSSPLTRLLCGSRWRLRGVGELRRRSGSRRRRLWRAPGGYS